MRSGVLADPLFAALVYQPEEKPTGSLALPHVNGQLRAQGIRFLTDEGEGLDTLTPDDVVILPAFGVTIELLTQLEARSCTLVDTTCGAAALVAST